MGRTLNAVDRLGKPFWSVDEQIFVLPEHGSNEVLNPCVKLVVMLGGDCILEYDGECDALGRTPFRSGDILVVPRVCQYRYWPIVGGSRRIHALRLQLDPEHVPPLADERRRSATRDDAESSLTAFARHHLAQVRLVPAAQNADVRTVLADIRKEAERRSTGYRFRVTALCTELLVHVVRRLRDEEPGAHAGNSHSRARLVNMTKEYLYKNLRQPLGLRTIARQFEVSQEHLARVFKQETGRTVFQHLQHLRLEQAKTLLLSSDRSMAEIAVEAGYSSLALFSRSFKRHIGTSPLRYRQQRWGEAIPSQPLNVRTEMAEPKSR